VFSSYIEHHRYIKTNEPKSAYALHILNNKHEYGPLQSTMELLKTRKKEWHMNILENCYIQQSYQKGALMNEQHPGEKTPLFKIIIPTTHNTHALNPIQVPTTQPLQNESTQITTQPASTNQNTGRATT
jgi:hypothetical protein